MEQTTAYAYNPDRTLSKVQDAEEGRSSYTYDKAGRLIQVTDEAGTITRTYDAHPRVTSYTDTSGNTIGYSYNPMGVLSELRKYQEKVERMVQQVWFHL